MDIKIKRADVLRYLGYKGQEMSGELSEKIDSLISQTQQVISPKNVLGYFEITQVDSGVKLEGTELILQGMDIKKHLNGCGGCYIFCATLGVGTENLIRTKQAVSVTDSLIADAAATAAIEEYCDEIERQLRLEVGGEGRFLTWRYSAGYGDFPFTQQPQILQLLQAEKYIGVSCLKSCVMMPRKSVTAVMGVAQNRPTDRLNKCDTCKNRDNCDFSCR
ncbi:MAG: methionine synthase [Oscillospiraceae bacterium]